MKNREFIRVRTTADDTKIPKGCIQVVAFIGGDFLIHTFRPEESNFIPSAMSRHQAGTFSQKGKH